jgi:hypothetical protein
MTSYHTDIGRVIYVMSDIKKDAFPRPLVICTKVADLPSKERRADSALTRTDWLPCHVGFLGLQVSADSHGCEYLGIQSPNADNTDDYPDSLVLLAYWPIGHAAAYNAPL